MSEKVNNEPVRPVARLRHWRQRFQKGAKYIWRRRIIWEGKETVVGAECPESLTSNPKKLRLFWEAKTIELRDFDGNNPGKKHLRADGTDKPDASTPAPKKTEEPAKAEDQVSGAQRKWNVRGLEEVFTSKGAAVKAAQELLDKQEADAAAKKAAEEAEASKKQDDDASGAADQADGDQTEGEGDQTEGEGEEKDPLEE